MNGPLDSRQLRAFATLARTGSFTMAAKELFLSQSAVSHSMKALESDIGCRLFDRVGKKVLLTQAGEQRLKHADKILGEMGEARESIRQLGKWGRSRLRIGASTTACTYLLPSVLREFRESFPQCMITIEPGDTPELLDLLGNNRVDLAIGMRPHREEQFEFKELFNDELRFLVGPQHPWARAGHVTRVEIPRQNYILYGKKSYTFRQVEDYFLEEDMVLNTHIELGSMEAIKEMVKLELGICVLAPWVAQKELREGSLVALPLGRRKLRRCWGVLHWKGRRLSLPEESFVGLCREGTAGLNALANEELAA
jgi:DNA-binding transcriptional LysR family regulator